MDPILDEILENWFLMSNYYFLTSIFPPIKIGEMPSIGFKELKSLLKLNLSSQDYRLFEKLLRLVDLNNIKSIWLNGPFDDRGNFTAKDLEDELLVRANLPQYIVDYLEKYDTIEDRLLNFASLYVSFFVEEMKEVDGFLAQYFQFERQVRLILTALRSKVFGKDLVSQLQFEDFSDPFVAFILAQRESQEFTPPQEYEILKTIFMDNLQNPQLLNKAILQYRFDQIEDMEQAQDFSIDRVLAFVARFMLVESLAQLDKSQGMIAVERLSHYG